MFSVSCLTFSSILFLVVFSTPGIDATRVRSGEFSDMAQSGPTHFDRSIGTEDFAGSSGQGTNSLESFIPSTQENTFPCTGVRRYTNDVSASLNGRGAVVDISNQTEEPFVSPGKINTVEEPDFHHDEDNLNGRSTGMEIDHPSDRINTREESDLSKSKQGVVGSCSTHAVYASKVQENVNTSGDEERTFTYFALLSTKSLYEHNKHAIQGKIKVLFCFSFALLIFFYFLIPNYDYTIS